MQECDVCCEKFNLSKRKQVSCPYCPFKFCRECCARHILSLPDDPSCMNCKRPWGREFLADSFTQVWMNTDYRAKREELLFERERSLMPATQHLVENEKKIRNIMVQNSAHEDIIAKNTTKMHKIQSEPAAGYDAIMARFARVQEVAEENSVYQVKINFNNSRIHYIRTNQTEGSKTEQQRAFVRACPSTDCRGFLSHVWKCGLCEVWVCPDCHEIKGHERDAAHTCDPGNLETARLLDKDSKPCPNCACMIFKIHGCDQMFCTQCHTAFSWRTGKIERNHIHNPHYYEYLRQRAGEGGEIRREIGDIPCGGMPYTNTIIAKLNPARNVPPDALRLTLEYAARGVTHIEQVTLPRYRVNRLNDNQDMRISYMIGDLDEAEFRRGLQLREIQNERKNAIAAIMNTYVVVAAETFRKLVNTPGGTELFRECLTELENIREFTNQALDRTSKMYKRCAVPKIDQNFGVGNY